MDLCFAFEDRGPCGSSEIDFALQLYPLQILLRKSFGEMNVVMA